MENIVAIVLAAGQGTRMKSGYPKVLHSICGRPMLRYVLNILFDLKIKNIIVVVGYKKELITKYLKGLKASIKVVNQDMPKGTADAISCAKRSVKPSHKHVLILYGDQPLLSLATLQGLLKKHLSSNAALTILTAKLSDPSGYGRIIRDNLGNVSQIVEDSEASNFEKKIREVNIGVCCFRKDKLWDYLNLIKRDNKKKEYYLTDCVGIMAENSETIQSFTTEDSFEALGVNSLKDLINTEEIMRIRILEKLIEKGVKIIDLKTTYIDYDVKIGSGTTIFPFTIIRPNVRIGKNCFIGPFCHIREFSNLADNVVVGNFIEINRSDVGRNTWMKHFGYLGDSVIDEHVNIGAGVVTANFDGKNKNRTTVKKGAFIGSDTILVAPVTVGRYAVTGAGSVVLRNKNVADRQKVAGVPARVLKK